MKRLPQYVIVFVAGLVAGFGAFAGSQIFQKKMRTAVFLAEARVEVDNLRQKVTAFRVQAKRYPVDAAELVKAGIVDPAKPPVERLRGSSRIVKAWDGEGGFLYLSATGQVYLNADMKREKLLGADIDRLKNGDLLPPGTFY